MNSNRPNLSNSGQKVNLLSHLTKKGGAVLKAEGFRGLVKRIQKRLTSKAVYYVLRIYTIPFDQIIQPPPPKIEVEIKQLQTLDSDFESLIALDYWQKPRDVLLSRLAENQGCFIAKYQDKIVAGFWWLENEFKDPVLHREFKLTSDEMYCHSAFTLKEFRGQGVFPHLQVQSLIIANQLNHKKRALAFIHPSNKSSIKSWQKLGARPLGWVGKIELLGLRFHFSLGKTFSSATPERFMIEQI